MNMCPEIMFQLMFTKFSGSSREAEALHSAEIETMDE